MPKVKLPKPTPDYRKMYQLAEHYSEASRLLDGQANGEEWRCSAPQLLDSFAVEPKKIWKYVFLISDADWEACRFLRLGIDSVGHRGCQRASS
jgi:hypothetical protein